VDLGIWAFWYDLPAAGREQYLSWLHGAYIPKILKKPGVLWAAHYASAHVPPAPRLNHTTDPAVPTGNDYILLFGGETANVFSGGVEKYTRPSPDNPGRMHADLTAEDRRMLAMRAGERVCIFTEQARVDGPEAHRREGPMAPAPCMQLGSFNAGTIEIEDELLAWYADWRMPALHVLPGCIAIRKLVSVSGWAKHAVLYEFTSPEARHENMPRLRTLYPVEGEWSNRFVPNLLHAPGSPVVGVRLWPPVK
jgi:hypothetical protein